MAENFSLTNPPVRVFFLEETNVVRWLLRRTCGISGGSYLETREWEGCISKEGKKNVRSKEEFPSSPISPPPFPSK